MGAKGGEVIGEAISDQMNGPIAVKMNAAVSQSARRIRQDSARARSRGDASNSVSIVNDTPAAMRAREESGGPAVPAAQGSVSSCLDHGRQCATRF